MEDWKKVCNINNIEYLTSACDVAISYYLQQPDINVEIIKENELLFLHCNYRGIPCHIGNVNISNIISCHLMNEHDFYDFTHILHDNNYFV